jgi:hypothetical protein
LREVPARSEQAPFLFFFIILQTHIPFLLPYLLYLPMPLHYL